MQVDNSLISRLEKLAKLKFSDEEREVLKNDLGRMLNMVKKLEDLDTAGVEPLRYLVDQPVGARIDQIGEMLDRQSALKNAPDANDEFFKVPKIKK